MHVLTFCIVVGACSGILVNAQVTLEAKFNLNGITGTVTFDQDSVGSEVTYTFDLEGINETYSWDIYQFRVNYDTTNRCDTSSVGARYGNLAKSISDGAETGSINGLDLSGTSSIEGRSIVLTKQSDANFMFCGTIESRSPYITSMARLSSTIAGDVIFRKHYSSGNTETTIYADLFYVDGTSASSNLKWYIYDGKVKGDLTESVSSADRCSSMGQMFNPESATGTDCRADHSRCAVGNLNGKLGEIRVGAIKGESKQLFHDGNLFLAGGGSIIDKTLFIRSVDGSTSSCGNIVAIKERQATASFSSDGVTGHFTITQTSPFDSSFINVTFSGLASEASGYHIHKWPVPQRLETGDALCSPASVSGHFNPFGVDTATDPSAGTGTPDQYEVGDISGKFGKLDGKDDHIASYTDNNLQLFGVNSVLGRSVVIHKAADGSRWVCANIVFSGSLKVSLITFKYPVIGHIQFQQPQDYIYAETSIYTNLNYIDGTAATVNHNWHIHVNKVGDDFDSESDRCMSVSGHYNPYSVDLEGNYKTQCNSGNRLRCELGDLSSKNGQLAVRKDNGAAKDFFTDVNLPLTGPQSITGRSVVIHGAGSGAGRLSCANIYEVSKRIATVSQWTSPITGSIEFEENYGIIVNNVKMTVNLKKIGGLAGGYHVHEYPVTLETCSPADVGGHLDPFGVGTNSNIATETNDKYEIGDLSAKFGKLISKNTYSTIKEDNNLPLRGLHSIIGRSVVIHKEDTGNTRWSCGNITEDISVTKGRQLFARAVFKEGNIQGYVEMKQYIYTDGGMSDTQILLDLKYNDGTANTADHNWHIHISPIGDDATASTGRCSSAGGHYNPFHSNLDNGYDECNPSNPLRCELGDLSNKLAKYEIGSGKKFFTDVNVPLAGPFTVIGRSMVFHVKNAGAARLACADILSPDTFITFSYRKFMTILNTTHAAVVLSNAINTDSWNIRVEETAGVKDTDCRYVKLYFVGASGDSLYVKFNDLIKSGNQKSFKEFSVPCSSSIVNVSVLLLLVMAIFGRWIS